MRDPLHIHYASSSRDCDGQYAHGWDDWLSATMAPKPDEEFYDIRVFERALTRLGNFSPDYEQTIRIWVADDGRTNVEAYEQTDEGYNSDSAIICGDPTCERHEPTHRDFTAERAGY